MRRQYHLLLHPAFLASLFLLLLNDISLKYQFHNALTGKLSDFCGLFAFALFWMALFPSYKKTIAASIAIFFCWWKSPLSTPLINSWSETMPFSIARVIDYWDLTALVVLPLALKMAMQDHHPQIKHKKFFIPFVGIVAVFAFCFTSAPRYAAYYSPPNEIRFYGTFKTHKTEQQILEMFEKKNIAYQTDSVGYYQLRTNRYYNEDYVLRVGDPGSDTVKWVPLNNDQDSVLYVRRREGKFYIIPHYSLDGHVINNIKLSINHGGHGDNYISVQTFEWNSREEFSGKIKRRYKAHFRELFK